MILGSLDDLGPERRRTWAAARVWAAHQVPYMASALLALDPVVVDQSADPPPRRVDLGSLPVDQAWHVYLDPEVVAELDVSTLGFWLIHQVSHLLRHHGERSPLGTAEASGPLEPDSEGQHTWNIAADAEINDDLVAGGAGRPDSAITPQALGLPDGWTAEQYWDALGGPGPDVHSPAGVGAGTEADRGGADRGGADLGGADDRSRAEDGSRTDCGSGCDGEGRPWETDQPGLGPASQRLVERDVARQINEHQRRWGNAPAGWQRWAQDILEPTVSWQQLLTAAVRRSSVAGDVVFPSLRQPIPRVAMVLDTSGSMDDHMLAQSLAEVEGVLRSLGVGRRHLDIVCCDAMAFEAQKVVQARDVQLLGGGGTDMGAGLAGAAALKPRPDLIVVLTDGHTPWPGEPPRGIRVIVGLMDESGTVPEWARAIVIGPRSAA